MIENGCYFQARYNMEHAYAQHGLRTVVGSLGIGAGRPFFEYGGPDYTTVKHFMMGRGARGRISWDAHVWLEDEDGCVYDVATQAMMRCADAWGKDISFCAGQVYEGVDKASLAQQGLVYLCAPQPAQALLGQLLARQWDGEYMSQLSEYDKVASEQAGKASMPKALASIKKRERSAEELALLAAKEQFGMRLFSMMKRLAQGTM